MTHKKASSQAQHSDDTIKDTFESIIIAFILAFTFRAYIVEAFVIPTGSMAPTLLGRHYDYTCPQCGFRWKLGPGYAQYRRKQTPIVCPMCYLPIDISSHTRIRNGDRILVHKFVYTLTDPKRWDVVVFKNPEHPSQNFIKRLAGLPNEKFWIIDGNVYTKPLSPVNAPWRIERKSSRPTVQRAVWQPVYWNRYVPLDAGKPSLKRRDVDGYEHLWRPPWRAKNPSRWELQTRGIYRYDSIKQGQLTFDFSGPVAGIQTSEYGFLGWYPYNQISPAGQDEPIEDIRLGLIVKPLSAGLILKLQTTSRLDQKKVDAKDIILQARIESNGRAYLEAVTSQGVRLLASGQTSPLEANRPRHVELWHVDQEAILWIDGKIICRFQYEVPIESLVNRPRPTQTPTVKILVQGAPTKLMDVQLGRDVFYSAQSTPSSLDIGRGTLSKRGGEPFGEPILIEADSFFCLGDNSPKSSDGRYWRAVNPWIKQRLFKGKQQAEGIVPRKLMIGKAFFVYFPAPYSWRDDKAGIFPNFGDMRFIH